MEKWTLGGWKTSDSYYNYKNAFFTSGQGRKKIEEAVDFFVARRFAVDFVHKDDVYTRTSQMFYGSLSRRIALSGGFVVRVEKSDPRPVESSADSIIVQMIAYTHA
uniref:Uncharacterized protein n=1 Tax=Romanomermis culicivorax TaxID=13658 RepID=A0A915JKI2_ROMCU